MSHDTQFSDIEEKLRVDASQLLCSRDECTARLWPELRRRRHAAQLRLASAASMMTAVVLSAVYGWRQFAETLRPAPHNQPAVASVPGGKSANHRHSDSPTPVLQASIAQASADAIIVPFIINDPAGGDEISGFYVPERVEPLDLRQLSPAERDAVRAVLDIDDVMDGEVI